MGSPRRIHNPWSLLVLAVLLATGLGIWSRIDPTPPQPIDPAATDTVQRLPPLDRSELESTPTARLDEAAAESAPPVTALLLGVHFDPASPVTGSELIAVAEWDSVPEAEVEPHFSWWVNGTLVQESAESRFQSDFRRGDEIVVEARLGTPPDAVQAVRERVLVGNAGPTIEAIEHRLNGGDYQAWIRATDPEGDEIEFECQSCPEGMIIADRIVRWKVGAAEGTFPVTVALRDPLGDGCLASFAITISNQKGQHLVVQ